jgi:hypothetical protein
VALSTSPVCLKVLNALMRTHRLGWMSGAYHGLQLINYSGGTYGFGCKVAFLPEVGLGIVILTNARTRFAAFDYAVQFRLLELLFDEP